MKSGDENRNAQVLVRKTDLHSTTHPYATIWEMRCSICGNHYGSNGGAGILIGGELSAEIGAALSEATLPGVE